MTDPGHQSRYNRLATPRHIVVMGVSGSGKSTLAQALAEELDLPMAEADEFHSPENIAKMSAQVPLTDDDRWPWLHSLRDWMSDHAETGSVITCSALRRSYRDVLRTASGKTLWLHVSVALPELETRLERRSDHFMPATLLKSQAATLEALDSDEDGAVLANDSTVEDLVAAALLWLRDEQVNGSE
ncbi:gluconokinase [Nesterenkonia sp. Act20]|uniref:gluconokinase n=1 Tax=Nesterenkonia sp. Act20 TaxID=1483432 RepID=UPI001C45424D|nr:gluconokinase [Nesterenkonia sp. Act20]